jgi:hypothetical protein
MPKTTQLASSCVMVVAPAAFISSRPRAPSSPIPVMITPTACAPAAAATERNMTSTLETSFLRQQVSDSQNRDRPASHPDWDKRVKRVDQVAIAFARARTLNVRLPVNNSPQKRIRAGNQCPVPGRVNSKRPIQIQNRLSMLHGKQRHLFGTEKIRDNVANGFQCVLVTSGVRQSPSRYIQLKIPQGACHAVRFQPSSFGFRLFLFVAAAAGTIRPDNCEGVPTTPCC